MMKMILGVAVLVLICNSQIIRLGTFAPCDAPVVNPQLAVVHRVIAPINCDPAPSAPLSYGPTLPHIPTPIFVPKPIPAPLPIPTGPVLLPPACDIRPKPLPLPVIPIIAAPACEERPKPAPQPIPVPPVVPACDKPVPSPAPKPVPAPPAQPQHSGPKLCSCGHHYVEEPVRPTRPAPAHREEESESSQERSHDKEGKKCKSCGGKDCKCSVHNPTHPTPKPLVKENGKTCDKCKDGKCECSDCKCANCRDEENSGPAIKPILSHLLHH